MTTSVIDSMGRITLPKAVREALGVEAGDRVRCFVIEGREVRLLPMRSASRLFGFLQYDGPPVTLDDMERAIQKGANKKRECT